MDIKSQQYNMLKAYNMLLYFAGSMIMYEPSEECVTDFWTKGILKNLPVYSLNPNFVKAASQLRDSCADKSTCGKILSEDFTRLFNGSDVTLAPAYESLYRKNTGSGSAQHTSNVTEFYNSYGWKSKIKREKSDDHLGIELLFLTVLIDKYLALDDEACLGEMRTEILRYIDQHILSWIPKWNEKIQANANTLCFKGIGTLILACSEDIFSIFEQKAFTPVQDDNLKN